MHDNKKIIIILAFLLAYWMAYEAEQDFANALKKVLVCAVATAAAVSHVVSWPWAILLFIFGLFWEPDLGQGGNTAPVLNSGQPIGQPQG